jgi:hypothetical protein
VWPFFFLQPPFRRINLRSRTRIVILIHIAAALLATNTRADDGAPEKPQSVCAQLTEARTCVDSVPSPKEGPAQESPQPTEKKKRTLLHSWLRMAAETQASQPDWLSPLATTSGRLKQEFRFDVWDQPSSNGNRAYQLGGNKGLELITSSRTQILAGVPSYTLVSSNGPPSGFGDLPLMLKIRIVSAPRTEGNYLLTFIVAATAPTGSRRYGAGNAVLTPTLAFGKGWRRFDVQSTFGANLPVGGTAKPGRQIQWNTAFQYHAAWKLWPELEVNSTFYETGKNASDKQLFLTPGLGFGRVRLGSKFRFSTAVGIQIAATRFHTYNHRWIFSERFSF